MVCVCVCVCFLFGGTICGATQPDLLSICLASGQLKLNREEGMSVCMTFPFVRRSGKLTGRQKAGMQKRCRVCGEQPVCYYHRNAKQPLVVCLSVEACGLPANLAFNTCLHFRFHFTGLIVIAVIRGICRYFHRITRLKISSLHINAHTE